LEIPKGYEAQLRSRSGLALRHKIIVANSPGTIDSDYRGECNVILLNFGDQDYFVKIGDRVAQLVFAKYEIANFVETQELTSSDRGEGGFGSTGK
jgi:dUTP pyrophosphatase